MPRHSNAQRAPTDYAVQVARIKQAFGESCREIDERPMIGAARAA